jgi:hypothetical protein
MRRTERVLRSQLLIPQLFSGCEFRTATGQGLAFDFLGIRPPCPNSHHPSFALLVAIPSSECAPSVTVVYDSLKRENFGQERYSLISVAKYTVS